MGFWDTLIKVGAPIVGGLVGGVGGAAVSGLLTGLVDGDETPAGSKSTVVPNTVAAPRSSGSAGLARIPALAGGKIISPERVREMVGTGTEGKSIGFRGLSPSAIQRVNLMGDGGNGMVHTVTIVVTLDNATGLLVREQVLSGSPFLMRKDVSALKKTVKAIGRASSRIPRRTVKEGLSAELTRTVKQEAIRRITGPQCPPEKC